MAELPANIREFNQITGVVFAQLYSSFPIVRDIDPNEVAKALGHNLTDKLESGRTFNEMLAYTLAWLVSQGFIYAAGAHPRERVVLTARALAAMNANPALIGGGSYGAGIVDAAKDSSEAGKRKLSELTASLLGNFAGGVIQTLSQG